MIWHGGLSWEALKIERAKWRRVFLWFPTRMGYTDDGHKVWGWLQWVEQRQTLNEDYDGPSWDSEYRWGEISKCLEEKS